MNLAPRTTAALAGLALAVAALAACVSPPKLSESSPVPVADPMPTPTSGNVTETPLTELPEWARDGTVWIVYPEGFMCSGTEGCPNDYRAWFGEPGAVLPKGAEHYDPAVHTWVFPADQ